VEPGYDKYSYDDSKGKKDALRQESVKFVNSAPAHIVQIVRSTGTNPGDGPIFQIHVQ